MIPEHTKCKRQVSMGIYRVCLDIETVFFEAKVDPYRGSDDDESIRNHNSIEKYSPLELRFYCRFLGKQE